MKQIEVYCGNIGLVYQGNKKTDANRVFATYVEQSKTQTGRAGGESVTMFVDGEISKEFTGTLERSEQYA